MLFMTRSFNPFGGAGAVVLSDPAWLLSLLHAANLPGRLPISEARLPYSSFRGTPQPSTTVTMRE